MSLLLSLDPTTLLLGGVGVLCVLWWLSTRRPLGLPPGPGPALPLLGHLNLLARDPRPQFRRWRRQYGDVFSLYMGGKPMVVLASYSAIREALVTFADVFSHRPHTFVVDHVIKNKGLVLMSGPTWKEQRKTSLEILRQMGMGKNVLAEKIQEEVIQYTQAIRDHKGAPVDLQQMTQISISNNICSIILGKRFDYNDPEFGRYVQLIAETLKMLPDISSKGKEMGATLEMLAPRKAEVPDTSLPNDCIAGTNVLQFLPVLRHLPGDLFHAKRRVTLDDAVMDFIGGYLADHQKKLDKDEDTEDSTDFIYSYLQEMRKRRIRDDTNTTLEVDHLQRVVSELFMAGTDTTSSAILWGLLFFLHHPHVQDKCFQEISDVIGPHRPPSMSDRAKMTYLDATICEVLRKGDIVPLSVQHATASDVKFRGYFIPKGAVIIPSLSCVMQDAEIWGDPENFRPERFIGPDGKLQRQEELIPFSTGRRVCLGESLARMELFLYLATLIQHFRFLPPEEGQLPSLEGELGITHSPQPYKIRAVPRM